MTHPRNVAIFLGVFVTGITALLLYSYSVIPALAGWQWMLFFLFISISISTYVLLNTTLYKELDNISDMLRPFKKKEGNPERNKYINTTDPIVKIRKELSDFAVQKQREIEELKKLETFRREFLADVSHELKTPLFAAQGFVHTLMEGAMDDLNVRERFLNKAAYSLDGLNVLVEDLITISQLEIGEIKMHFQNFDIRKLTEDIFEQLEDTAEKKGTRLKFNKYSPKSCYIHADKLRIGQVVTNLIVNAIKYGKDNGTVVFSYTIENESVLISVKDDGPGIEEPHLNRIFERFYRVEKSRSKDKGGSGLGLSIVKHILEAHDSRIHVTSKVNEGTEFQFRLKKGKVINEKG
ncbi:sensor histidine kinase [Cytophaga hutchinsonii]|uniref:histidine kinase n=1 Tax=Cytophaga hutchinsonii (strain ATCC 33406 / DSM 1761 / CIP 103989 / NBRC 15051 / NCIMB 9469 / D465) TaxID=269798 RepID=A0A6N4SV58_CYTH3|nr:ATP-binding protein [Cytophaga hutchinsonii]ABG60282.1 two-component sensor histidine kinase, phosphate regulation [Cytophaga hutchinsonii ATCC 33406]SFX20011.1 two-component system, OmpR family, phosphate regulon sensor histidine kinase PhoR [Cytophaga hutchinsonii ATCC 33406]